MNEKQVLEALLVVVTLGAYWMEDFKMHVVRGNEPA